MAGKLKELSKRKLFWTFLLSYLMIILLPMFTLTYSFNQSLILAQRQLEISDRMVLEQFSSSIDSQLFLVMQIGDQLAFDTAASYFCERDDLRSKLKSILAYENIDYLQTQLSNINAVYDSIRSCYIYYSYSDRVVSFDGVYDSQFYFSQRLSNLYDNYQQWISSITAVKNAGFICIWDESDEKEYVPQNILYVRRIQWYEEQRPAYVVVMLSNSLLDKQSLAIRQKNDSAIAISNSNLNILYASDSDIIPVTSPSITDEDYGSTVLNINDKRVRINWIRSKTTGCIYFISIPENLYNSRLSSTIKANLLMFFSTLLGGILLSVLLANRRYRPIRSLREFAGKYVGNNASTSASGGEDFYYIREALGKLADEKRKAEQEIKKQNTVIKNSIIERLLYSNFPEKMQLMERLEAMNIRFDTTNFAVAILKIENQTITEYENMDNIKDKNIEDIKSLLSNGAIWTELLGRWFNVYTTQIDDDIVLLINFRSGGYEEEKESLRDSLAFCHKLITEKFNVSLSIYASDVQHSFAGIHKAFRDALLLSEYCQKVCDVVFAWEELPESKFSIYYSYKPETEQKLINLVAAGKIDEAKDLILKVHEENAKKLPPWFEKLIIIDLLSSCLKSMNMVRIDEESSGEIGVKMRQLLHEDPEKYCIDDVLAILEMVCNYVQSSALASKSMSIDERIQEIIKNEYANSELSLSLIAQYLDLNPSYVSALYKKCTNESLVDSINQYRIKKAMELLANTSKNIKEIATEVGYYNSAGFIRAFKKYKGITPGQYRDMNKNNQVYYVDI